MFRLSYRASLKLDFIVSLCLAFAGGFIVTAIAFH